MRPLPARPFARKRILLLEPDPWRAESLRQFLAAEGFEVRGAGDPPAPVDVALLNFAGGPDGEARSARLAAPSCRAAKGNEARRPCATTATRRLAATADASGAQTKACKRCMRCWARHVRLGRCCSTGVAPWRSVSI